MEIVVKIPDDIIKSLEQGNFGAKYNIYDLVGYLMNGTPLPKGHGDLIDKSEAIISLFDYYAGKKTVGQCIDEVQPIIEADKEDKNESNN